MSADTPLGRAKDNATGLVSMLVTGTWLAALFLGFEWWLPFMLFGYIVLVPATAILLDDEDELDELDDDYLPEDLTTSQSTSQSQDTTDALQTLRDRYARGDLTEEQFERKLERLLETETVEDAAEFARERQYSADLDDEEFESEQV